MTGDEMLVLSLEPAAAAGLPAFHGAYIAPLYPSQACRSLPPPPPPHGSAQPASNQHGQLCCNLGFLSFVGAREGSDASVGRSSASPVLPHLFPTPPHPFSFPCLAQSGAVALLLHMGSVIAALAQRIYSRHGRWSVLPASPPHQLSCCAEPASHTSSGVGLCLQRCVRALQHLSHVH